LAHCSAKGTRSAPFLNLPPDRLFYPWCSQARCQVSEAGRYHQKISCHGLHRTCLTNKAARNMNAFALQRLAGHQDMETTRIYVQLGTEDLRPMMEATGRTPLNGEVVGN